MDDPINTYGVGHFRSPACTHRAFVFGRLVLTTCLQAQGARLFDRATTIDLEERRYDSIAIRLGSKKRPRRAVVIGWRRNR